MGNGMWGTNEELDLSTHVCHEAVSATLVLGGKKNGFPFFYDSRFEYGVPDIFLRKWGLNLGEGWV